MYTITNWASGEQEPDVHSHFTVFVYPADLCALARSRSSSFTVLRLLAPPTVVEPFCSNRGNVWFMLHYAVQSIQQELTEWSLPGFLNMVS